MRGINRISASLIALLALLSASGCDTAVRSRPEPQAPLKVRVAQVRVEQLSEAAELSGTVHSVASADLTARVMAQVISVSVEQGDRVSSGQLLVQLDARELRAGLDKVAAAGRELAQVREETEGAIQAARSNLAQAQSTLTLAQATFERFQPLLERQAVSPQEFDEVKAKRDGAKAAVEAAESHLESILARPQQLDARADQIEADRVGAATRLEFSEVRAPFSGVVLVRHVDPGDLASPASPLITLERPFYRLEVEVEESLVANLRQGQELEVEIPSTGETLSGTIGQVAPGADPRTRTTRVKIDLPQNSELRSGLFGRVRLPGYTHEVLTLPGQALVERGQLDGVFVIQDGRASFRVVRLGRTLEDRIVVLSGLPPGQEVILEPSSEIRDGIPIEVISRDIEEQS